MPNIIKRGETERERYMRARFSCYHCGCVWTPEENDNITYNPGYDQRDGPSVSMSCPTCGKPTSASVPNRQNYHDDR